MTQTARTVTLVANGVAEKKILDGCSTTEFFQQTLGLMPAAGQIRVNGAEFLGDPTTLNIADGDLIQVLSEAVADKGVAGAIS